MAAGQRISAHNALCIWAQARRRFAINSPEDINPMHIDGRVASTAIVNALWRRFLRAGEQELTAKPSVG